MTEKSSVDGISINKDMTIAEILSAFPQKAQKLAQELTNMGLSCVGCQASVYETLEAGILGHGMDEEDLEGLIERLNNVLAEKQDADTIALTQKASAKFQEILREEGRAGQGLRLGHRMAGCSGFEYILDYSEKAKPTDRVFTSFGIEIHVEEKMVPFLMGVEIDYVDALQDSGFKISNPNARSSCGCGSSHGY